MLVYQVRPRAFWSNGENRRLSFPNYVEVQFVFSPPGPFGGVANRGRTAAQHKAGKAVWDSNTGRQWVVPEEPFDAVGVVIEYLDLLVEFAGKVITLRAHIES